MKRVSYLRMTLVAVPVALLVGSLGRVMTKRLGWPDVTGIATLSMVPGFVWLLALRWTRLQRPEL